MTPRLARKLAESGLKEIRVPTEELVGLYIASDLVNEETGEIYAEAGDEITEALMEALNEAALDELPTLAIDHITVGPSTRNPLAVDKNTSREAALIDIYRGMQPGEPPTLETAETDRKSTRLNSSH